MIRDLDFKLLAEGYKMLNVAALMFWLGLSIAIGSECGLTWGGLALALPMVFDMVLRLIESAIKIGKR